MSDKNEIPPHLNIPHPAEDADAVNQMKSSSASLENSFVLDDENNNMEEGLSSTQSTKKNTTAEHNASISKASADNIIPKRVDIDKTEYVDLSNGSSYSDVFKNASIVGKIKTYSGRIFISNMGALKLSKAKNSNLKLSKIKYQKIFTPKTLKESNVFKRGGASLIKDKICSYHRAVKGFYDEVFKCGIGAFRKFIAMTHACIKANVIIFNTANKSVSRKSGVVLLLSGLISIAALHVSFNIPNAILPQSSVTSSGTSDVIGGALVTAKSDSQFENSLFQDAYRVTKIVKKGHTLDGLLNDAGVANDSRRNSMFRAMRKSFNPRNIFVGQKFILDIVGGYSKYIPAHIETMEIIINLEKSIVVSWDKNKQKYFSKTQSYPLAQVQKEAKGVIKNSLFYAMEKQGVKRGAIVDFLNLFSFDVDFQRDIRKNDSFDIVYKEFNSMDGVYVRSGDIVVAELSVQGNRRRYYHYINAKGREGYYDYEGKSGRKALMKTPIEGARLSSSFGRRNHPVLGYSKFHNGTDFAAPRGTPIFAAGDGKIEYAGRKGANGIYVRIRHNGTYKTSYSHMSAIAPGVRRGKTVKQGKVIGYVGTTGRSTGNHLHYSVFKNGKAINSRTMKLPSGGTLKGKELKSFMVQIKPLMKDGR